VAAIARMGVTACMQAWGVCPLWQQPHRQRMPAAAPLPFSTSQSTHASPPSNTTHARSHRHRQLQSLTKHPPHCTRAAPHMGSAYPTIAADVVSRYQRLAGRNVNFLTGTDEHGEKIATAAAARGLSPQEHCDAIAQV
jgi:hypothetical protein